MMFINSTMIEKFNENITLEIGLSSSKSHKLKASGGQCAAGVLWISLELFGAENEFCVEYELHIF